MKPALIRCVCLLGLVGAACATPSPSRAPRLEGARIHVVRRGETLWSISQRYGTKVEPLARANRISDVTKIRVGQRIVIPSRRGALRAHSGNTWIATDRRGRKGSKAFIWPAPGPVTSGFGVRNGAHHDGVDISVRERTPVRAAEAGRVIHSDDSLAGYGNMIIVKHAGAFSSVYAHNHRNLVKVGEFVEKGQVIAESGQTGRTTAPHLHFEIRRNGKAVNPLTYLR